MEQITLTKEELKEIIAKEVRNAIKGEKPISSGAIFSKVRINNDDLEEKGRCNLKIRMQNRKGKMLANGATKTQINKLSKLDVITDEPRLVEIYISVIKSMAIKYGVDISQFEI